MCEELANKTKNEWRRLLKEKRKNISEVRRLEATIVGRQVLLPFCSQATHVLSYSAFGSEYHLDEINQNLMQQKKLILSTLIEDKILLYRLETLSDLEKHVLGFWQPNPKKCESISAQSIDLALIPGLGFDVRNKIRLGYGKGHYDRFLFNLSHAKIFGVGFKEQAVEHLPQEKHDVRMHEIYLF